jgi:hypothetical protein
MSIPAMKRYAIPMNLKKEFSSLEFQPITKTAQATIMENSSIIE